MRTEPQPYPPTHPKPSTEAQPTQHTPAKRPNQPSTRQHRGPASYRPRPRTPRRHLTRNELPAAGLPRRRNFLCARPAEATVKSDMQPTLPSAEGSMISSAGTGCRRREGIEIGVGSGGGVAAHGGGRGGVFGGGRRDGGGGGRQVRQAGRQAGRRQLPCWPEDQQQPGRHKGRPRRSGGTRMAAGGGGRGAPACWGSQQRSCAGGRRRSEA